MKPKLKQMTIRKQRAKILNQIEEENRFLQNLYAKCATKELKIKELKIKLEKLNNQTSLKL